uniref:CIP2 protein n=1 Tax=[Candida] sp. HN95 TaxID=159257 RepID=O42822_9ASCO|nr:CIP2 protein [[Candida] sp. HN95]
MFELLVSPIKSRAVDWDVVHSLYTERKAHEPAREEPQSWDEFVKILALDETVLEATARTTVSRKTFRVHYDDFPWWKHLKNIWGDSSIRIWLEKCYVKVTFSLKYLTGLISYLSGIGLPGQGEACSEFVYYELYNGENWIISIILTTTDDKGTCDTKPSKDDIANIVKEADANLNEKGNAAYCTRLWQGENWQGEVRVAADSP